jgi:hypothetical protein
MRRSLTAFAVLVGMHAVASPASAGTITDGLVDVTITVLNRKDAVPLIGQTQRFAFSEPILLEFGPLGSVEAAAIVGIDPDPVVTYEFSLTNTTEDPLLGALVVDFDIVPVEGGVPGSSFLEAFYEGSGGTMIGLLQHLSMAVSCDLGPGGDGIELEELTLSTTEAPPGVVTVLEAGPVAIPEAPDGTFDRLCVQLSFNELAPGDSLVLRGITSIAPPPEACDDGVDNDGDGLVDCDDAECEQEPICVPEPAQSALFVVALGCVALLRIVRRGDITERSRTGACDLVATSRS